MGSFETRSSNRNPDHQPVRVALNKRDAFEAAREMCTDLGWTVVSVDEQALTIISRATGGFLGGSAEVVVRVEGPEGIPSSTTHVSSRSGGGVFSKDKGLVAGFVRRLRMRTC